MLIIFSLIKSLVLGAEEMDQFIKSLCCSYRASELNSQHLLVTPVTGDSVPSSDLCRHQAHTWCAYIHSKLS